MSTQRFCWVFLLPVVLQIIFTLSVAVVSRKATTSLRIWWMALDNSFKILVMGLLMLFSSFLLVQLAGLSPIWNGFLWVFYGISALAGIMIGPILLKKRDLQKKEDDPQKKMRVYVWGIPAAILLFGFLFTAGGSNPMSMMFTISVFLFIGLTLIGFAGCRNLVGLVLYLKQKGNNAD
jgi:hypothetical protein